MSHQLHCNSKRQAGTHLSYSERQFIERLFTQNEKRARKERLTQNAMAELIGISPATLSRELKRGAVRQLDSQLREYTSYSAYVAQEDYASKASRKGPGLKIGRDRRLAQVLERYLLGEDEEGKVEKVEGKVMRYSPDATIMELDHIGWPTSIRICTRTLYNYLEADLYQRQPEGLATRRTREEKAQKTATALVQGTDLSPD